jgi:hypothetical protein
VAEAVSCVEEGRTEKIVDRSSLQLFFPSTALFFPRFFGFFDIFIFHEFSSGNKTTPYTSLKLLPRQIPSSLNHHIY